MNQYLAIFRVPVATMEEWKKNTKPEEIKAQSEKLMQDMMAWMEKHKASFVGQGYPMGKTKTVTTQGITDTRNDLNYCQIVQADSHEAAAKIFTDCPHMRIPTSSIDVMEIPHAGM